MASPVAPDSFCERIAHLYVLSYEVRAMSFEQKLTTLVVVGRRPTMSAHDYSSVEVCDATGDDTSVAADNKKTINLSLDNNVHSNYVLYIIFNINIFHKQFS